MRVRSALAALLVVVAALVGATLATPATAGAAGAATAALVARPRLTDAQRAAAFVAPAMIFVEVRWEGWVRLWTGPLADDQPVSVTTRCSGFAVSNDGHLLTSADCVSPDAVENLFFAEVARRRVERGTAAAGTESSIIEDLTNDATIVGEPFDTPVKRTVWVQRGEAVASAASTPSGDDAWPAEVIEITDDLALLKSTKGNQPLITLGGEPDEGQRVLTTQYPFAADGDTVRPSSRVGSISATEPTLVAHAGPSAGLVGAPVVTMDAQVVGLVRASQGPTLARDLLTGAAAMKELLKAHEVVNELGPVDTHYRSGIDALLDGRYTDAVEDFDAVLAIVPSHVEALAYRQQAQDMRLEEGGGRRSETITVVAAVSAAAAFLVISGVVAVVLRRRRERRLI